MQMIFARGKVVRAHHEFAASLQPILREGGLQISNCRSPNSDHRVAPSRMSRAVLIPMIRNPSAADEPSLPIHDQQFAMGAVVVSRKPIPARGVVPGKISAGGSELAKILICGP